MADDIVDRLLGEYPPVWVCQKGAEEILWLRRQLHAAVLIINNYNNDHPENIEAIYELIKKEAEE